MVLDTSLLNTQHYKVRIKGKGKQFMEKEERPPLYLGVVAIEKRIFGSPSTKVDYFIYINEKRSPLPVWSYYANQIRS